jgi:hypothetical protein
MFSLAVFWEKSGRRAGRSFLTFMLLRATMESVLIYLRHQGA